MDKKAIKLRIVKTESVDIAELEPFQGSLKTLSEVNFNKLRNLIIEEGFSFAVHVWENAGVKYIIDGHQRVSVLVQMRGEGFEVPPITCNFISAKKYSEAKKLVLMAVSQYGKMNLSGFEEFVDSEDFVFDDFDFPDFKTPDYKEDTDDGKEISEPLSTSTECPKCGYEY